MSPGNTDPYRNYRFIVEMGGEASGFSEVSGLQGEAEVIEYREGSDPLSSTRKLPGRVGYGRVTLRRGVDANHSLYAWWKTVVDGAAERRDVSVQLLDEARQPVRRWILRRAFPVKYEAPDLNATGNEVALETLELAHEGLELVK